jgi:hypothetical protein
MTAIVGNLPHSKPTMVRETEGSSDEFQDFVEPESDMQNEQGNDVCEEIQNLKQQSHGKIITSELQDKIDMTMLRNFSLLSRVMTMFCLMKRRKKR